MKVLEFSIGNWIPRTKLHLDEFFVAIKTKKSPNNFSRHYVIERLVNELNVESCDYLDSLRSSHLVIKVKEPNMKIVFYEDGVFFITPRKNNSNMTPKEIIGKYNLFSNYFYEKMVPLLKQIYNSGASTPRLDFQRLNNNLIIQTKSINKEEVEELFRLNNDIILSSIDYNYKDIEDIFTGNNTFVIKTDGKAEYVSNLMNFILDYNNVFKIILESHRELWNKIKRISEKKGIRIKDVPKLKDKLMNMNNTISIIETRFNQMRDFIPLKRVMLKKIAHEGVSGFLDHELDELEKNHNYIKDLWLMTKNYCSTTLIVLKNIYLDSQNKEMNVLEAIFMISTVASIISLGTLSLKNTSNYYDAGNNLVFTSITDGWDILTFIQFGLVALFLSAIIIFGVKYLFEKIVRLRKIKIFNKNIEFKK